MRHVGHRHLYGESARLGHCLGLQVIPQVTVLTLFTSSQPSGLQYLKTFTWQDSLQVAHLSVMCLCTLCGLMPPLAQCFL